jgi:RimJ/RimL family protein N-acetyltransferase
MNQVEFFKPRLRRVVRNAPDEVKAWASHRLNTQFREPCLALGVLNNGGHLVGAAIFNDFEERNVEVSLVGPGVFYRGVAKELFHYAFDELGCWRISLTIHEKNKAHLKLADKFGWKVEGRKRNYYGHDHAIIMGMLRHECKLLRD